MDRTFFSGDWKEGMIAEGGIFRREFDLENFLEKVESQYGKVVALKFDGSHNMEVLFMRDNKA